MDNDTRRAIAILAASTVTLTACAVAVIRDGKKERLKREEIKDNTDLDIQAIKNATAFVSGQIDAGQIRSLAQLREAVDNEIAFQKIAIREN